MSNASEPAFPQVQTKHNKADHASDYFNVFSSGGLTKREMIALELMKANIIAAGPEGSGNWDAYAADAEAAAAAFMARMGIVSV